MENSLAFHVLLKSQQHKTLKDAGYILPSLNCPATKEDYYNNLNSGKIFGVTKNMLNRSDGQNHTICYQRIVKVPVTVVVRELKVVFGLNE